MAGGYQLHKTGMDAFEARLRRIERRLDAQSASAPSRSTVIGSGGITIKEGGSLAVEDADGDPQVRVGALSGGGYGLEQIVGSDWVPLAALAGGAQAITINGTYSDTASGSFADTGYVSTGSTLTFHTYTGKFLLLNVASTAAALSSGSDGSVYLGYTASGAITRAASTARASYVFAQNVNGTGAASGAPLVYVEVVEGLPGDVTIRQAYRVLNGDGGFAQAQVDNRAIVVFPF
jgi:hypothetical protein